MHIHEKHIPNTLKTHQSPSLQTPELIKLVNIKHYIQNSYVIRRVCILKHTQNLYDSSPNSYTGPTQGKTYTILHTYALYRHMPTQQTPRQSKNTHKQLDKHTHLTHTYITYPNHKKQNLNINSSPTIHKHPPKTHHAHETPAKYNHKYTQQIPSSKHTTHQRQPTNYRRKELSVYI